MPPKITREEVIATSRAVETAVSHLDGITRTAHRLGEHYAGIPIETDAALDILHLVKSLMDLAMAVQRFNAACKPQEPSYRC